MGTLILLLIPLFVIIGVIFYFFKQEWESERQVKEEWEAKERAKKHQDELKNKESL